jgi:hypothetical protein
MIHRSTLIHLVSDVPLGEIFLLIYGGKVLVLL